MTTATQNTAKPASATKKAPVAKAKPAPKKIEAPRGLGIIATIVEAISRP